ncbi:MAG: Na(+)/H(+) antiporter subunit D [Polyangiaceae bacterium]|nr:Na(+)/H(+) antiporter subunit D [Polyangiaceae bacterium]
MNSLPPGFILILGAFLIPFLKGRARQALILALPCLSLGHLLSLPSDHIVTAQMFDYQLAPIRVDKLSLVWGYVFHIAAGLTALYSVHEKNSLGHVAGLSYAGSAIAAAFAADWITLFVFWELTAITSVFLIWARRTKRAYTVGLRYLLIQVGSGVILLAGVLIHVSQGGSLLIHRMGVDSLGGKLIFLAFGIKCAFPLLHNWLQDAYPEATVSGAVFLSAFTTKLAIYALARVFPGTEILIPIGITMTLFPILFAVIENDLRRVLAYSLNNQLGYMVVGVGIGTELSLNGTAAHAFAHILYKGLLFMAMGAVLFRVGTVKANKLGGLYKSMPWTTVFCIIGSLSISGFPLFSGFVTKSMTLTAVSEAHLAIYAVLLLIASAGVVDHSGIKIPFFAFFAHDNGHRVKEAPLNMLLAMGGAAALCIGLGLYPAPLYKILPYPVDYAPYTVSHVVNSLQLLLFAALAFGILWRTRIYPPEIDAINLDTDWIYRKAAPPVVVAIGRVCAAIHKAVVGTGAQLGKAVLGGLEKTHAPPGVMGEPWGTGATSLWAAALLGFCLMIYYL